MGKIYLLILILAIIWLSITIGIVIPSYSINGITSSQPAKGNYGLQNGGSFYFSIDVIIAVIYAMSAVFIISLILYTRETVKLIIRIMLSFLGFFAFIGLAVLLSYILNGIDNFSDVSRITFIPDYHGNISPLIPFTATFIFFIILLYYYISNNMNVTERNQSRERMIGEIDDMIKNIRFSDNIKGIILKTYYDLENFMQKYGIIDSPTSTPEEFGKIVQAKFPDIGKEINTIIKMFEKVKYGNYDPDMNDKNNTINALENIKGYLSYVS
ncbi:MAG: DUF4129 domain-containing protein [Thermoplasmata archaeon]